MAPKKHTHRYTYKNIGKIDKPRWVYACAREDCSHFMPEGSESLLVGKKTQCHSCLKDTILTQIMISKKIQRPRCFDCKAKDTRPRGFKKKKPIEAQKMDSAIDMILKMRL
jgi:hypothetical protein